MSKAEYKVEEDCWFADDESIACKVRDILKREFEDEKKRVLASLPDAYKANFHKVGFCRGRPIQILGPYDVAPGKIRKEWLNKYQEGDGDLPFLVHWISCTDASLDDTSVTLEAPSCVVTYKIGQQMGLADIPQEIQENVIRGCLSEEDKRRLTPLRMALLADESGNLICNTTQDYELYALVPRKPVVTTKRLPKLNEKLAIYWPRDKTYYPGYVSAIRDSFFKIQYEDGEVEWLPINDHEFKTHQPPEFYDPQAKPDDEDCSPLVEEADAQTSTSQTDAVSIKDRLQDDGCMKPLKPPKKNDRGGFVRPSGRSPKGYEWNQRKGFWVPSCEDESCLGKRGPTDPDVDFPTKRPKTPACLLDKQQGETLASLETAKETPPLGSDKQLGHSKIAGGITLAPSQTDVADVVSPAPSQTGKAQGVTPTGNPSQTGKVVTIAPLKTDGKRSETKGSIGETRAPLKVDQDTPTPLKTEPVSFDTGAYESIRALAEELETILGVTTSADGSYSLESVSNEDFVRVEDILVELSSYDPPFAAYKRTLMKPIRKLTKSSRLGVAAKKFYVKMRHAYDLQLLHEWKYAIQTSNVEMADVHVRSAVGRIQQKKYPMMLSAEEIKCYEVPFLVESTMELFKKQGVGMENITIVADNLHAGDSESNVA